MSQFEEIPSPGRGFQGSRALGGLAACKTLASLPGGVTAEHHLVGPTWALALLTPNTAVCRHNLAAS